MNQASSRLGACEARTTKRSRPATPFSLVSAATITVWSVGVKTVLSRNALIVLSSTLMAANFARLASRSSDGVLSRTNWPRSTVVLLAEKAAPTDRLPSAVTRATWPRASARGLKSV